MTAVSTFGLFVAFGSSASANEEVSSIKDFQNEVHTNVKEYENTFEIKYSGNMSEFQQEVRQILPKLIDNDDMVAGTLKSYSYRIESTSSKGKVQFNVNYFTSKYKDKKADELIKKEVAKIRKTAKTDFEKVKAVNDFIVKNTTYGGNSEDKFTAYGLMENKYAVCQGYALVAYKMLNQLSVPTRYVVGVSHNQDHAWNKVKVSGVWYNLDTTWNDPYAGKSNQVSYKYFLVSDKQLAKDHSWITSNYPQAKNTKYDFLNKTSSVVQVKNKLYYSNSADNEKLYEFNLSNNKKKKISNTRVQYIVFAKNKLYFSNYSSGAYLSSMTTAGKSLKIHNRKFSSNLEVKGSYVYYNVGKTTSKLKI